MISQQLAMSALITGYIDPGTGGLILQILLSGLAGLAFIAKLYWTKLKLFYSQLFSKQKKSSLDNQRDGDS